MLRKAELEIDIYTDRQTDRHIHRQTNRQTDKHIHIQTNRQKNSQRHHLAIYFYLLVEEETKVKIRFLTCPPP